MTLLTKIPLILLALVLAIVLLLAVRSGLSRLRPPKLGLTPEGNLQHCSPRPNCVSSEAPDREHQVLPLAYRGDRAATQARLADVFAAIPRLSFVTRDDTYWHLVAVSRLFRFTDDLELSFDDAAQLVHLRSASRVGHSDLGVNRKRVRALREAYEK